MEGLLGVIVSFVVPLFEDGSCGECCGSVGRVGDEVGFVTGAPVVGVSPSTDVVLLPPPELPEGGTLGFDEAPPLVVELVLLSAFRRFCTAEPALC